MFNLEQSIAEWRRKMIAKGIKTPVPLEELENHLREDIEQQGRTGADMEEAFRLAAERIGKAENVREEFGKIEDAKRARNRELLRRWSVIAGTGFVLTMMSITWYFGARSGNMEITWVEVVLALGAMAAIIAFDWVGRSVSKYLPVIHDGWIFAIALGALFFGALLFRIFIPEISPANVVHLQIVVLWALSPTLGFGTCVSVWHERCERIRRKSYYHV